MTKQTLATALAKAQTRNADTPPAPPLAAIAVADDATLLSALRNCATGRDQILQRRLGLTTD